MAAGFITPSLPQQPARLATLPAHNHPRPLENRGRTGGHAFLSMCARQMVSADVLSETRGFPRALRLTCRRSP